jgi:hypothetical protein
MMFEGTSLTVNQSELLYPSLYCYDVVAGAYEWFTPVAVTTGGGGTSAVQIDFEFTCEMDSAQPWWITIPNGWTGVVGANGATVSEFDPATGSNSQPGISAGFAQ